MKLLKIFFYIVLIVPLFNVVVSNTSSQEYFLQANVAYKKTDFKKAVELYQSIDNKGAATWYNLGNCWYHLGNYTNALACWKRAVRYGGSFLHNAVEHNCSVAYQKLGTSYNSHSLLKKIITIISGYSFFMWQILFLIMFYIFLGLTMRLYRKRQFLILSIFFCFVSLTGSCLGIKYWVSAQIRGIIKNDCSAVAGTDERFSKITMLGCGQEVVVKEQKDLWCKIQSNGQVGWILTENIEYI